MVLLKRNSVFAAAIEGTIGTAESLDAGDAAMNCFNFAVNPDLTFEEREGQGGMDMLAAIPQGRRATATCRTNIQWDGTATEPSWAETFFPACGWVKSGQVYTPRSEAPGANVKTLTIAEYVAGHVKTMTGAMGNFTINLTSGQTAFIEWEFVGSWVGVTEAALLTPTYPTDLNLRFAAGASTWDGVALFNSTAQVNSGNTLYLREDPSKASGFINALVTTRRPTITLDPESKLAATQDRWGKLLLGSEHALILSCGGSTNSVFRIDAPKAQIIAMVHADREKLLIDQMTLGANKNGATQDESLSITFTAAT
jgi:hypothetical protein